jgi:HlyD family secretion protein
MSDHSKYKTFFSLVVVSVLLIAGCGQRTQEATPTGEFEDEEQFIPIVSATGVVVPEVHALLSLSVAGLIDEVIVAEGDVVEAGQVLLELQGREQVEASLAQAQLELVNAQQALDEIFDTADTVSAQAALVLAEAKDALKDARYKLSVRQEGHRASEATLDAARANLVLAEDEVKNAQEEFDSVRSRPEDDLFRALALSNLAAARQKRDSILRNLNWYTGHPTEIEQALLDGEVAVAEARLAEAEAEWDRVKDGPDPKALELGEARLATAKALVKAAEAALDQLELTAPFAGTVSEVHIRSNEWVAPGQPVILMADLQNLRVETTDLNEIDMAQVDIGDEVIVTFDALPDVVVTGRVVQIAPKAAEGSGVNFPVVIEIEKIPESVRWGMTAFVDIQITE